MLLHLHLTHVCTCESITGGQQHVQIGFAMIMSGSAAYLRNLVYSHVSCGLRLLVVCLAIQLDPVTRSAKR
jgi:hypothetical protein